MADPKLQKLADLLRAGYVSPSAPVSPLPSPAVPMDPAAYRVDRFMRTLPATLTGPPLIRQLAQAAALRSGPTGRATPSLM
jgi:hypothetical protein